MSPALSRYSELLDRLFLRRALGPLSDDEEERYAEALNDCRREMSPQSEAEIDGLVARKRALQAAADLGLEDISPERSLMQLPRREVHP